MSKKLQVKEGIVTEKESESQVTVSVLSGVDCENCSGSCGSSGSTFDVTASDSIGVKKGDRVKVEIEPRSFGKIASIVFGAPTVALVGGLGLGSVISNLLFAGDYGKPIQGGGAGFLFLVTLAGLVVYDRYLSTRSSNRAEIVEIVGNDGGFNCAPVGDSEGSFV